MNGQYRKCRFCGKRFRLMGTKGIIRTNYNYVSFKDKYSPKIEYGHKKCYENYLHTAPSDIVSELKAGFDIQRGIFIEGTLSQDNNS